MEKSLYIDLEDFQEKSARTEKLYLAQYYISHTYTKQTILAVGCNKASAYQHFANVFLHLQFIGVHLLCVVFFATLFVKLAGIHVLSNS